MRDPDPLQAQWNSTKAGCVWGCFILPSLALVFAILSNDFGGPLAWPIIAFVGGIVGAVVGFAVARFRVYLKN